MLTIQNMDVFYDKIHALKSFSIDVKKGEIVTLIGANGSGKTTALKAISGLVRLKNGSIFFNQLDLSKQSVQNIVKAGICQVPEGRHIFADMSVSENLEMGAFLRNDHKQIEKEVKEIFLMFPNLKRRLHQPAGTLSGGEQQMLAISRALLSHPKLLLLDEPSMGLAPIIVKDIFKVIQKINQGGVSILLVEQNVGQSLEIADRAYVMENGNIRFSGTPSELLASDSLRQAYLGV